MSKPLLEVSDLDVGFGEGNNIVTAINGISFSISLCSLCVVIA